MAKEKPMLSALERAIEQALGSSKQFGLMDDPASEKWPNLWQWLSTTEAGRDNIKVPATLSIRLGPEGVLISLVDKDLGVSLDASCAMLADAFQAIEDALSGPHPALKSWGKSVNRLRKRQQRS